MTIIDKKRFIRKELKMLHAARDKIVAWNELIDPVCSFLREILNEKNDHQGIACSIVHGGITIRLILAEQDVPHISGPNLQQIRETYAGNKQVVAAIEERLLEIIDSLQKAWDTGLSAMRVAKANGAKDDRDTAFLKQTAEFEAFLRSGEDQTPLVRLAAIAQMIAPYNDPSLDLTISVSASVLTLHMANIDNLQTAIENTRVGRMYFPERVLN